LKSYEWAFKLAQECASKIELMILGIPRFNTQEELRGFPLTLGNLGRHLKVFNIIAYVDKSRHDFTKPNATFPMGCSIGNELLSFCNDMRSVKRTAFYSMEGAAALRPC